jgi:hypothetical protein
MIDLSRIPTEALYEELGRRRGAARTTHAGPPRKPANCPRCGVLCDGTRAAREHACPRKRQRKSPANTASTAHRTP